MSSFIFIRIPMISDLTAACLNFHHFDNSEQTWRHLATLGKRQLLPPFTRVCLNFSHLGRRGDIIKKIKKNTDREGSLSTSAIYHELSRRQPKTAAVKSVTISAQMVASSVELMTIFLPHQDSMFHTLQCPGDCGLPVCPQLEKWVDEVAHDLVPSRRGTSPPSKCRVLLPMRTGPH